MASHLDFRYLDEGLGGERGKRKRREEEADAADSMDLDADAPRPSKLRAVPSQSDPSKPAAFGQPTYDGVIAGRVSGRTWKEPRTRRSSALMVSRKPVPLEQRVRDKSLKKAYQARVAELKDEIDQSHTPNRYSVPYFIQVGIPSISCFINHQEQKSKYHLTHVVIQTIQKGTEEQQAILKKERKESK